MKQEIRTEKAPKAIGPYSQGILSKGSILYVSGQLPVDPQTGEFPAESIEQQTRQSLENIKAILQGADLGMERVVKTTVRLAAIADFGAMNAVYGTYFAEPFPARAAFEVGALPKGARVEIEVVAVKE